VHFCDNYEVAGNGDVIMESDHVMAALYFIGIRFHEATLFKKMNTY